jgi:hypothetical protein
MGTVPPTNAGLSNLLQTLSNIGSPAVSNALGSPAVQQALQNASPGDIVKLSEAALELQQTGAMFGVSSSSSSDPLSTLASPEQSLFNLTG